MATALVISITVNVVILAIPKLTTSKRYYRYVFGMSYINAVFFYLPINYMYSLLLNNVYGLIKIKGLVNGEPITFDFSSLTGNTVVYTLITSLLAAYIGATIYTMTDDRKRCCSCLKCLKPYRRSQYWASALNFWDLENPKK